MRRRCEDDAALQNAETLLLMPDLLGYFLTGEKASAYTNVTTTMLSSPEKRDWDREIICKLEMCIRDRPFAWHLSCSLEGYV